VLPISFSVDVPVVAGGVSEDDPKAGEPCDWGECVEVIDAVFLSESTCDEARLVLFDGPVGLPLDSENPLAADNVLAGGSQDSGPRSGLLQSGDFAVHGLLPLGPIGAGPRLCESLRVAWNFC